MGRKAQQKTDDKANLVGREVKKFSKGCGFLKGKIVSYNALSCLYKVVYEGGDREELDHLEIMQILVDGFLSDLKREGTVPEQHRKRGRPRKHFSKMELLTDKLGEESANDCFIVAESEEKSHIKREPQRKHLMKEEGEEFPNDKCLVAEVEEVAHKEGRRPIIHECLLVVGHKKRGRPEKYLSKEEFQEAAYQGVRDERMVAASQGIAHRKRGWLREHRKEPHQFPEEGVLNEGCAESKRLAHRKSRQPKNHSKEKEYHELTDEGAIYDCMVVQSERVAHKKRGRPRKHPREEDFHKLADDGAIHDGMAVQSLGLAHSKSGRPGKYPRKEEREGLSDKGVIHDFKSEVVVHIKREQQRKYPREEEPKGLPDKDAVYNCTVSESERTFYSQRWWQRKHPREEEPENNSFIHKCLVAEVQEVAHRKRGRPRKHTRKEGTKKLTEKGAIHKYMVAESEEVANSKQRQLRRNSKEKDPEELPDKCAIHKSVIAESEEVAHRKRGRPRKHPRGVETLKENRFIEASVEKRNFQGILTRKHKNITDCLQDVSIDEATESSKPVEQLVFTGRSKTDVEKCKQKVSFQESMESSKFSRERNKIEKINLNKHNQNAVLEHGQECLESDQSKILRGNTIKETRVNCMEKTDPVHSINSPGVDENNSFLKPVALEAPSWRTRTRLKCLSEQLKQKAAIGVEECNQKSVLLQNEELLKPIESQLVADPLILNEHVVLRGRLTRNSRRQEGRRGNLVYCERKSALEDREDNSKPVEVDIGHSSESHNALKLVEWRVPGRRQRRKLKDLEARKQKLDINVAVCDKKMDKRGAEPFDPYLEECNQNVHLNLEECTQKTYVEGEKFAGHEQAALEERGGAEHVKGNVSRSQQKWSKLLNESLDVEYTNNEKCRQEVSFLEFEEPLTPVGHKSSKERPMKKVRASVECVQVAIPDTEGKQVTDCGVRQESFMPTQSLLTDVAKREECQVQKVQNRIGGASNIVPKGWEESFKPVEPSFAVPQESEESMQLIEQISSRERSRTKQKHVEKSKQPVCEENFCKAIEEGAHSWVMTRSSKNKQQRESMVEEESCQKLSLPRKTGSLWKYQRLLQSCEYDEMDTLNKHSHRSNAVSSSEEYMATESLINDSCKADGSLEEVTGGLVEVENILPLQPLPPSSRSLPVPQESVAKLFSVYSFLRSFSRTLFLSPFGFEDFLTALYLEKSNSLIDSVHASLLQALRRQLERLSQEGCSKAKVCLRQADWNFLDVITWPSYLLSFLSTLSKSEVCELKIGKLKLCSSEYYILSISTKLDILSLLCDHVIETDEIRAELDMREFRITNASEKGKLDPVSYFNQESQSMQVCQENESILSLEDINSCIRTSVASRETSEEVGLLDRNIDECVLCGMDGNLICCDGCPAAYHGRCVGISKGKLPPGDWFCPECVVDRMDGGHSRCIEGLRGSSLLGVDPFGRIFMATCGYLLVSYSAKEFEFQYNYYSRQDLPVILQFLENLKPVCNEIQNAIVQLWKIDNWEPLNTVVVTESGDALGSVVSSISLDFPPESSTRKTEDNLVITSNVTFTENDAQNTKGYATVSMKPVCNPLIMPVLCSGAAESVYDNAEPEVRIDEVDLRTADGLSLNDISTVELYDANISQDFPFLGQLDRVSAYVNHYVLGDIAATSAANLALMTLGNNCPYEGSLKKKRRSTTTFEQLKAFSQVPACFYWPSLKKKLMEIPKERCGWCFACINPTLKKGCLLNLVAAKQSCGAARITGGIRPAKKNLGHLSEVGGYLLYMEESLHNLLIGPWENLHYRKLWRKKVDCATSVYHLKSLLLQLESKIRPVVLLDDWYSQESSPSVKFGNPVGTVPSCDMTKKIPNRKSTRRTSKTAGKTVFGSEFRSRGIQWQRCGKAFHRLLDWQTLPVAIARQAGRQGGLKMINGLFYTEGWDFPKRSIQCAWRARVELSCTVSQLAIQVRHLDANIRWNDLFGSKYDEKAVIYSKAWREDSLMYLINSSLISAMASKQKASSNDMVIPEQALNGERPVWKSEMQIPLCLLSDFEEKLRLRSQGRHLKLATTGKEQKCSSKSANKFIFDVLLQKLLQSSKDSQESAPLLCGVCMLELTPRDVAHCQVCQASCHGNCAAIICLYAGMVAKHTCFTCFTKMKEPLTKSIELDKLMVRKSTMELVTQNIALEKDVDEKSASVNQYGQHINIDTISLGEKPSISTIATLTGSYNRMINGGEHEPLVKNATKEVCAKSGSIDHYSRFCTSPANAAQKYVLWRKNDTDSRSFNPSNVLLPRSSLGLLIAPCCFVCKQSYDSELLYIACERCSSWFHGDALGVTEKNFTDVTVFKCHKCRKKGVPYCPYSKREVLMKRHFSKASSEFGEVINVISEGNLGDVSMSTLIASNTLYAGYSLNNHSAVQGHSNKTPVQNCDFGKFVPSECLQDLRKGSETLFQNCDYGRLVLSNSECLQGQIESHLTRRRSEGDSATEAWANTDGVQRYRLLKHSTAMDVTSPLPLPIASEVPSITAGLTSKFPRCSEVKEQTPFEKAIPVSVSSQRCNKVNGDFSLKAAMVLDGSFSCPLPLASESPILTAGLEAHSPYVTMPLDLVDIELSTTCLGESHLSDHGDISPERYKSSDIISSECLILPSKNLPEIVGSEHIGSPHVMCIEHMFSSPYCSSSLNTVPLQRGVLPFTERISDVKLTLDSMTFGDSSTDPDVATATQTVFEVSDNPLVTGVEVQKQRNVLNECGDQVTEIISAMSKDQLNQICGESQG